MNVTGVAAMRYHHTMIVTCVPGPHVSQNPHPDINEFLGDGDVTQHSLTSERVKSQMYLPRQLFVWVIIKQSRPEI